jgi:hypothetical protein
MFRADEKAQQKAALQYAEKLPSSLKIKNVSNWIHFQCRLTMAAGGGARIR